MCRKVAVGGRFVEDEVTPKIGTTSRNKVSDKTRAKQECAAELQDRGLQIYTIATAEIVVYVRAKRDTVVRETTIVEL